MKNILILKLLLFYSILSFSQDSLQIIQNKPISLPQNISVDRYFNFYLADKMGQIKKHDALLNYLLNYSPAKPVSITQLEAWNTVKIFLFSRDFQQNTFFDRFLGSPTDFEFSDSYLEYARIACPSADNNIWAIDESDFSLKKVDCQFNKLIVTTPLDLLLKGNEYDIQFMREYQNNLFVVDKNTGILQFDNFGNYKRKFEVQGIDFIGFIDEWLYYYKDNKIQFIHLYKPENKEVLVPVSLNISKVIVSEEYYYLFAKENTYLCKLLSK